MANGDDNKKHMYIAFLVGIVLAVLVAFAIAFWGPGNSQMEKAKVALAYGMLILLFMFGFVILLGIALGSIDISRILEEKGADGSGAASMSRFQLLIFTLVIGLSFFYLVLCSDKCEFPNVGGGVLMLLGISATTYGVSKGIQASAGSNDRSGGNGTAGGSSTQVDVQTSVKTDPNSLK
jgi:FtsH-binding integral membrane protein